MRSLNIFTCLFFISAHSVPAVSPIGNGRKRTLQFNLVVCGMFFLCTGALYAQQGKNGVKLIGAANTIVNEYTPLTADAASGSTFIKVTNSALNTNTRFAQPLAAGDLVMIIQMQGATIKGNVNDSTWGAITSYNNCGLYELSEVSGVPNGTTINLNCSLKNSYTASGKTQVVRIPRFSSLTVANAGSLTCDAWDGTKGGIVAAEVQGNTTISSGGSIVATGKGFRGGQVLIAGGANTTGYYSTTADMGGAKGESIAGCDSDYTVYGGKYARGAPANGGGGGDQWNGPGGGGANAGNVNAYTGDGVPDTSTTSWKQAWDLEYKGFSNSHSSGGGRGGYTISWFPVNNPSPLLVPPGNIAWGDTAAYDQRDRSNVGGRGGRPLDYSTGRIFLAGGGGAGHEDAVLGIGGSGGAGGGIVYLISYGTVSGGGSIISNGLDGKDDNAGANYGDGVGGAGGGGTVIVSSAGPVSNIAVTANGGKGGNQYITINYENEGAGGGGGGGYVAISNSAITPQAAGGANGTTNSPFMTLFPPNGATKGDDGIPNAGISSVPYSSVLVSASQNISICPGGSAPISASGGLTYAWSPSATLSCDTCSHTIATPLSATTYVVTVTNGSCSGIDSVVVSVLDTNKAGTISASVNPVCQGSSSTLTLTGSAGVVQWQFAVGNNAFADIAGVGGTSYSASPDQNTTYRVVTVTGFCQDTSHPYTLNVNPVPATPLLSVDDSVACFPDSALIISSGPYTSYLWNNGSTTNTTYADTTGNYGVTVTDGNGCSAVSAKRAITIVPTVVPPVLTLADSIICSGDSTRISTSGSYATYFWNNYDSRSYTYAQYAGNYWVTVTDANGCSAVSAHKPVVMYPIPSVSIVLQGDTFASFDAVGYQWFFNGSPLPGDTSSVYIAHQSGNYALEITDENGCKARSVDIPLTLTGIDGLPDGKQLSIYPDPFTNTIFIRGNDASLNMESVTIYDVTGRTLLNEKINDALPGVLAMDVSTLAKGMYYIKIKATGTEYVRPVVKQ